MPGGLKPGQFLTEADGYGWTYVNAAFGYPKPAGSRFNGPERGAWYAAYGESAAETVQAELSWHLTQELAAAGQFKNKTRCRELFAGFTSEFHDLNGHEGAAALDADPASAYPAGQSLAREILVSGGNGLLYPSARHSGGQCLAALRPRLVQNIRQGDTIVFEWDGIPSPAVRRQNG